MQEITMALDAAFAAHEEALATGASETHALEVGLARYRAFFPDTSDIAFKEEIEARFASSKRTA